MLQERSRTSVLTATRRSARAPTSSRTAGSTRGTSPSPVSSVVGPSSAKSISAGTPRRNTPTLTSPRLGSPRHNNPSRCSPRHNNPRLDSPRPHPYLTHQLHPRCQGTLLASPQGKQLIFLKRRPVVLVALLTFPRVTSPATPPCRQGRLPCHHQGEKLLSLGKPRQDTRMTQLSVSLSRGQGKRKTPPACLGTPLR